jgi:hypothetical protein
VGRLSDVYSLGAILYCLLTGRPPFQASTRLETLFQVQRQEPVPPKQLNPGISLDLDTIVLKSLDKSPVRRYGSAKALADELQRYLDGRPVLARPVGRVERFWRWCRREPWVSGLGAALLLALIAGTAVALSIRASNEKQRQQDYASSLVHRLASADVGLVPGIMKQMAGCRKYADPLLRNEFASAPEGTAGKLYAALALAPIEEPAACYVRDQLVNISPVQFPIVRDLLAAGAKPPSEQFVEPLWGVATDVKMPIARRFQAACALATYAPNDNRWRDLAPPLAKHLVGLSASELVAWRAAPDAAESQGTAGDHFPQQPARHAATPICCRDVGRLCCRRRLAIGRIAAGCRPADV